MNRSQAGTDHGQRYRIAALIAVAAVVISVVWGVTAGFGLWSDVQDFPRGDIPGELTVDLDEASTYYVYYERREWFATVPVDVDIEITVTGPGGDPVPTSGHDGTVNYRLARLVGQAHARFQAAPAGSYTVTIDDVPPHDDATMAVGESVTGTLLRDLVGPAVVLVAGLGLAGVVAATAKR